MGAAQSKSNISKPSETLDALDQIASKLIFTQNFQDMKNLSKKEYCNGLIVLTSDIIKKYFKEKEIEFMASRVRNGITVNKLKKEKVAVINTRMTKSQMKSIEKKDKEYILQGVPSYLGRRNQDVTSKLMVRERSKSILKDLDILDKNKKERMCKGIAKFYIKIAHLFAAIMRAINPVYSYTDSNGKLHQFSLMNKNKIPAGANVSLTESNLCTRRINAVQFKEEGKSIKVNISKACNINNKKGEVSFSTDPDMPSSWGQKIDTAKTLGDETGIPELEQLYMDVYDYDKGEYNKISKKNQRQYKKDLKTFYQHFTGGRSFEEWDSDGNKRFSDIPLTDYSSSEVCHGEKAEWKKTFIGNDKLFQQYADNIRKMMSTASQNQEVLVKILHKVFVWFEKDGKTMLTINPKLTQTMLNTIVENARNQILELYFTCEKDFKKSLQIFQAILKQRMLQNTISKTQNLEEKLENVIHSDDPEVKSEIKQNVSANVEKAVEGIASSSKIGGRKYKRKTQKKQRKRKNKTKSKSK